MKKEKIFIFICLVLLSACSPSSLDGIVIEKAADGYKLSIDGRETYIKGVGGTYRLDIAAQSGANAFRTWGGNVEEIKKNLALASEHTLPQSPMPTDCRKSLSKPDDACLST